MSQFNDIINQLNSLTGYQIPTASGYIISQSANPLGSGSVNNIINQLNNLTGFNIPSTQVQFVSGSNVAGPIIIYTPYATDGTIPTNGIVPGGIIKAEHILRVINALNGVNIDDIIISGSLQTSGSNIFNGTLSLPFIPDGKILFTTGGFVVGVDTFPSASYALTASYFSGSISNALYADRAGTASYTEKAINAVHAATASFILSSGVHGPYGRNSILSASYAFHATTASYVLPSGIPLKPYQIATGSVTASVSIQPSSLFLIKSASVNLVTVDNTGSITMKGNLTIDTTGSFNKLMSVSNNSTEYFKLNEEGVLVLHQYPTPPTVVVGGIYFNTTGEFFIGT